MHNVNEDIKKRLESQENILQDRLDLHLAEVKKMQRELCNLRLVKADLIYSIALTSQNGIGA
ncbi:MAG: hypothetical protein LBI17_00710 [Rickettsiales bacterium]|jgi:DNA-nicking Smr family endonuclease|nr:hypothetical protein [Rickettsiales bacterium]